MEGKGDRVKMVLSSVSDTLRYINLTELVLAWLVVFRGPIHLYECVREDRGDGEGVGHKVDQIHLDTSISPSYP